MYLFLHTCNCSDCCLAELFVLGVIASRPKKCGLGRFLRARQNVEKPCLCLSHVVSRGSRGIILQPSARPRPQHLHHRCRASSGDYCEGSGCSSLLHNKGSPPDASSPMPPYQCGCTSRRRPYISTCWYLKH